MSRAQWSDTVLALMVGLPIAGCLAYAWLYARGSFDGGDRSADADAAPAIPPWSWVLVGAASLGLATWLLVRERRRRL